MTEEEKGKETEGEIFGATREGVKRYNDIKMALADLAFRDAEIIAFPAYGRDGWVGVLRADDIRYVWIVHTDKNPVTDKSFIGDHLAKVHAVALAIAYGWRGQK
jgi:hypothetical protein